MTELKIEGMTCQHCVRAVTEALADVGGVDRVVAVDLDTGMAKIEGDADHQALVAAVREDGYEAAIA